MVIKILFELVIFTILMIQLYQLTVEYVLPTLREQIAERYKRWKDLEEKLDLTKKTKKTLTTKIKEQEEAFENLEQQVQRWHESLAEKKSQREQEQATRARTLLEKKKGQLERLSIMQAKQAIMPDAIAQTKVQLSKNCAGDPGKKFLADVINSLGTQQ